MEETALLLTVVEKAAAHSQKFSAIVQEATARLVEINEECKKNQAFRAAEAKRAEAAAAAKAKAEAEAPAEPEPEDEDDSSATNTTPTPGRRL